MIVLSVWIFFLLLTRVDVSILSAINTMVQGSENQSNDQFHNPTEVTVSRTKYSTWKNQDTDIHRST